MCVLPVPTPLLNMTSSALQPVCTPLLAPTPSSVVMATTDSNTPPSQVVVSDRADTRVGRADAGVRGVDAGGEETSPSSSRLHVRRVSDSLNDLDSRTALVPHTVSVSGSFGTRGTS